MDAKRDNLLDAKTKEDRVMAKKDLKDLGLDSKTKYANSAKVLIHEFVELGWVDPFRGEATVTSKPGKSSANGGSKAQKEDLDYISSLEDGEDEPTKAIAVLQFPSPPFLMKMMRACIGV